jgi:cobalt-zinc-cadmium efflux system outer membrane protein
MMTKFRKPSKTGHRHWHRSACCGFVLRHSVAVVLATGMIICSIGISFAQPETTPSGNAPTILRLSLNDALALFLKQNLDLLMAQYGVETAKGQQITAHLFPNPVLNSWVYTAFTQGHNFAKSTEVGGTIQQLFEVAGKRGYRIESAGFGIQTVETNFIDTVRQLSYTVKDSYFRVQAGKRHLELAEENQTRFNRILEVNTIRYNKGYISGVDLIRIKLQAVDFQSQVIVSTQEIEGALADLRTVLGVPPTTKLELTSQLEYHRIEPDLSTLEQLALENRPDILAKRLTRSQREADLNLARAYRYPDPNIGPGMTVQGPTGPDNQQQYVLALTIPLPVFNRNQGGIVQAEVSIQTADADLRKTLLQVKNQVELSYRNLIESRRLAEVYQEGTLKDARDAFIIIEHAFEKGGVTILDLLDAARTSRTIQQNYIDALFSYQRNLFLLESAVAHEVR